MKTTIVDTNVILDVLTNDPNWADWSQAKIGEIEADFVLVINPVIYSELSIGFDIVEDLDATLRIFDFGFEEFSKRALFIAGKAFFKYRRLSGTKRSPLPDFFIGAQAQDRGYGLLTRDPARYRNYFPQVELICPAGPG